MSRFTRKFQVVLATMALVALSVGSVAPVSAQVVLQGLGVAKGCVSSTPVGSPYTCAYGFTNNSGVNPSNNTITVTSVVDSVFASGGNVSSATSWVRCRWSSAAPPPVSAAAAQARLPAPTSARPRARSPRARGS